MLAKGQMKSWLFLCLTKLSLLLVDKKVSFLSSGHFLKAVALISAFWESRLSVQCLEPASLASSVYESCLSANTVCESYFSDQSIVC
jgi:hypothetical protein